MRRAVTALAVLTASSLAFAAADGGHPASDAPSMSMSAKPATADAGVAATLDIPKSLTKDDEKIFYVLGLSIGKGMEAFSPSKSELDLIKRGMSDGIAKPEKVTPEGLQPWGPKVSELAKGRGEAKSKVFLDKAAKEKGATKIDDGILYTSVKDGTGATPKPTDKVKVNYKGTLPNGTVFDSSYKRGQPIEFPLNGVIPCWTKGLQKMKVGGKAKLVCPPKVAYGERGQPPTIPPNSPLTFEVELLDTQAAPPPAPTPAPGAPAATPQKK